MDHLLCVASDGIRPSPGTDGAPVEPPADTGAGVVRVSTTEVRWILAGAVPEGVARWFDRFARRDEAREDLYLRTPRLGDLSVKVRGGGSLDVKLHTRAGEAPLALGPVTGRTSTCHKWSFAFGPPGDPPQAGAGWTAVGKLRRLGWFSPGGEPVPPPRPGAAVPAGCAVELTDITLVDGAWWTLGFEATGPAAARQASVEAAAATVFDRPLPAGVHLGTGNCRSYAAWLAGI